MQASDSSVQRPCVRLQHASVCLHSASTLRRQARCRGHAVEAAAAVSAAPPPLQVHAAGISISSTLLACLIAAPVISPRVPPHCRSPQGSSRPPALLAPRTTARRQRHRACAGGQRAGCRSLAASAPLAARAPRAPRLHPAGARQQRGGVALTRRARCASRLNADAPSSAHLAGTFPLRLPSLRAARACWVLRDRRCKARAKHSR
jgi:hypothetical protein